MLRDVADPESTLRALAARDQTLEPLGIDDESYDSCVTHSPAFSNLSATKSHEMWAVSSALMSRFGRRAHA